MSEKAIKFIRFTEVVLTDCSLGTGSFKDKRYDKNFGRKFQ